MRTQSAPIKIAANYWLSICAALLIFALMGCTTTGNVDPKYDLSAHTNTGLLIFSVTHDADYNIFGRRGHNIYLAIYFRNIETGDTILRADSNDWGVLIPPTTPFGNVWGTLYVREFAAGRYELSTWSLHQNTGVGINSFTPKQPPFPITFEVRPGSVTYIGNVHGDLLWKKNFFGIDLVAGAIPQVKNEAERDVSMTLKDYPQLNGKIVVAPIHNGSWQADSQ